MMRMVVVMLVIVSVGVRICGSGRARSWRAPFNVRRDVGVFGQPVFCTIQRNANGDRARCHIERGINKLDSSLARSIGLWVNDARFVTCFYKGEVTCAHGGFEAEVALVCFLDMGGSGLAHW